MQNILRESIKMLQRITKIACILPSRIGDIVFAFPAIRSLKNTLKNSKLTFFVDKRYKDLVELNPDIDEIIDFDFKSLKNPINILKAYLNFRKYKFDIVFDMQGYLKSSLLTLAFKAKYKFGTSPSPKEPAYLFSKFVYSYKELENVHRVDRHIKSLEKIFEKYLKIPFYKDIKFLYSFKENEKKELLKKIKNYLSSKKNYYLLFLGGGWKSRRWGYQNYLNLALKLKQNFNLTPIVVGGAASGSPEDEEYELFFQEAKKVNLEYKSFYKKLSLKEFVYLCKYAKKFNIKFFIGNDAGATHISWSSSLYTFEILGPTSPNVVRPYISGEYIYKNLPCSPCRNRDCQSLECMKKIKVEEVFDKISSFLASK